MLSQRYLKPLVHLILGAALLATPSLAQTIFGSLSGTVTDSSGSVISGAHIVIRNLGTDLTREATSDSEGFWRVPALAVGNYQLEISASALQQVRQGPIAVNAAVERKIDIALQPSSTKTVVDVQEQAPLIEATDSQLAGSVDSKAIFVLPTGGNTTTLASLMPGYSSSNTQCCSGYSINGGRARANHFTVDGADNNDPGSTGAYQQLPAEDIQEYHLIENNYSAEFGRNSGSVSQLVTKSGTNQLHGIETWTFNGPSMNALQTSQKRTYNSYIASGVDPYDALEKSRAVFSQNTLLASLAGPIEKNKLFFFGSWDGNYNSTTALATTTTITPAGFTLLQNNANIFAPGSVNYLKSAIPAANTPTGEGSLSVTMPSGSVLTIPLGLYTAGASAYHQNQYRDVGKLDYKLSDKDTASLRWIQTYHHYLGSPQAIPINRSGGSVDDMNAAINEVHVFSPNLVAETRLSYVHYYSWSLGNFTEGYFNINGSGLPSIGYNNQPQGRSGNIYELGHTLSWIKGNHDLRIGGSYFLYQVCSLYAPNAYGSVSYPSFQTFLFDQQGTYTKFAGNGIERDLTNEASAFVNDQWRVTPALTLNLGVRWDLQTTPSGYYSNASPNLHNFSPRLGFAYAPKATTGLMGLLFGGGKGVIRGGFGIIYENIYQTIAVEAARNYPRGISVTYGSLSGDELYNRTNLPPNPTIANFTGNQYALASYLFSPNHEIITPYTEQLNIGIERQVAKDTVLRAFYIRTKGVHLLRSYEGNVGILPAAVAANPSTYASILQNYSLGTSLSAGTTAYLQNPAAGSSVVVNSAGRSNYNALEISLGKRYSSGVSLNAHYTWSSFLDDSDDLDSPAGRGYPSIPWDWLNDYGRSAMDTPQRFVMSAYYDIPDLARHTKFSRFTGGWQLGGILTLASGEPYNIWNANDALGILQDTFASYAYGGVSNSQRPSYNPNGVPGTGSSPTVSNPMYIANATNSGIIGNLGPDTMRTGGTTNLDFQVLKNVRLFREGQSIQLYSTMTDIFNHRNFTALPANIVSSSTNNTTFLNLGYTNVAGRTITIGARIIF